MTAAAGVINGAAKVKAGGGKNRTLRTPAGVALAAALLHAWRITAALRLPASIAASCRLLASLPAACGANAGEKRGVTKWKRDDEGNELRRWAYARRGIKKAGKSKERAVGRYQRKQEESRKNSAHLAYNSDGSSAGAPG